MAILILRQPGMCADSMATGGSGKHFRNGCSVPNVANGVRYVLGAGDKIQYADCGLPLATAGAVACISYFDCHAARLCNGVGNCVGAL